MAFGGDMGGFDNQKNADYKADNEENNHGQDKETKEIVQAPDNITDIFETEKKPVNEEVIEINSEEMKGIDKKQEGEIETSKIPDINKAPELVTEEVKIADNEIKASEGIAAQETQGAVIAAEAGKDRNLNNAQNEIMPGRQFKDLSDKEKPKHESREISAAEFDRMTEQAKKLIDEKKWYDLILQAEDMHDGNTAKFEDLIESEENPFTDEVQMFMLKEIKKISEKTDTAGEKADPKRLASEITKFLDCFPLYKKAIKISKTAELAMEKDLDQVRQEEHATEELTSTKSGYWKVKEVEKNQKELNKMIKRGDVKVAA